MERFLEYWQACRLQDALHAITQAQSKPLIKPISQAELSNSKIANADLLKQLVPGLHVIIPVYARQQDNYFFPYVLLVELNATGEFITHAHTSLPIIPECFVEPSPLAPISLGWAADFQDYIAINPPLWQDDAKLLTWASQQAYAQEVLQGVNSHWQQDLQATAYVVQEGGLILSVASLIPDYARLLNLKLDILRKPKKVRIIEAPRNSGKSIYAKRLIIDAWIAQAVAQKEPPRYVWLQPNAAVKYTTIFECMPNIEFWPVPDVYDKLRTLHREYTQGQAILRNWVDMDARLQEKYADKGGMQARLDYLQASYNAAHVQNRHMSVLHAIWLRQKELISGWSKAFDVVPMLQKNRLQRLHNFFAQNFPDENVTDFSEAQFDDVFLQKVHRAKNNERMLADAMHQVEADQHQEKLIRERCLQWCERHELGDTNIATIEHYLQETLWLELARLAGYYWQVTFSSHPEYAQIYASIVDAIDLLIVEDAQYIATTQALPVLAKTQRAVVMGSYDVLGKPRFAVHIDYALCQHYKLIENDADFEDLQFAGVLGSIGNLWNLMVNQREADDIFTSQDTSIEYELVDVATPQAAHLGSYVNQGVVQEVITWLQKNPEVTDLAIYTTFAAQLEMLRDALAGANFAHVPIYAISLPRIIQHEVSIFVPGYAAADPGPYVFDQGREILDQLRTNTRKRLIIIGDMRIFKPNLHSASGNFAKAFITTTTQNNKQEEVACV